MHNFLDNKSKTTSNIPLRNYLLNAGLLNKYGKKNNHLKKNRAEEKHMLMKIKNL